MVVFGVVADKDVLLDRFVDRVRGTVEFEAALNGRIHTGEEGLVVVSVSPSYPPVYIGGILCLAATVAFKGFVFSWWLLLPALLVGSHVVETRYFWYFFFVRGLRKAGYKGRVKLLSSSELFDRVVPQ